MSRTCSRAGVAAVISLLLSAGMMSGCSTTTSVTVEEEDTATVVTSSGTSVDGSDSATDEATAAALAFDSSSIFDENGRLSGISALDYVTLPEGYLGMTIPADAVDVEASVQEQIDSLASSYSTTEQVTDRAVADGDTVNIDYVGTIDGVEFSGGSTQGAGTTVTIGVTQYIDDFLQQVVGHKPGETFDVEVTFPENYGVEELNGKDAVFTVTVNYIEVTTVPEVTDLWVSSTLLDTYGWTTVDEMRAAIAEDLLTDAKMTYVTQYMVENSQVSDVPQEILDYCKADMLYQYAYYAQTYGFTLGDFVSMMTGGDIDALVEANMETIQANAKSLLVFQAIAEAEGIEISDDFVSQYFYSLMGVTDISGYVEAYGMPYLKMNVSNDTAISKVAEYAVVEGQEAEKADEAAKADDAAETAKAEKTDEAKTPGTTEAAGTEKTAEAEKADGTEKTDETAKTAEAEKTDEAADAKADDATEAAGTEKTDEAKAAGTTEAAGTEKAAETTEAADAKADKA